MFACQRILRFKNASAKGKCAHNQLTHPRGESGDVGGSDGDDGDAGRGGCCCGWPPRKLRRSKPPFDPLLLSRERARGKGSSGLLKEKAREPMLLVLELVVLPGCLRGADERDVIIAFRICMKWLWCARRPGGEHTRACVGEWSVCLDAPTLQRALQGDVVRLTELRPAIY